jgi:hypothetical protein|tara:strand:+ start:14 stop:1933 length:1920 start_codon:yes stop_codon:yes gene_type:complete
MAEYESIKGTRVKYLSSDPTLTDSSTEGQVWYNSTSGVNKSLVNIRAFSAGGNIPTRFYYGSGVGPATSTLGFGGVGPSPQPAHNLTIEYYGFNWASRANLNTARRAMYQFGTSTAAVGAGGDYSPASPTLSTATEEYDGSSWTNGNAITEQGSFGAAAGTLTAGLAFGGYNTAQTASSTRTVSYDGTNWTALPTPGSDTNTAGNFTRGGGGTQTAAIFSGGGPSRQLATEAWDGSSWTSLANMNLGRSGQGLLGTQTNALYAGGIQPSPSRTAVTEEWDGSAWATSSASLAAGRNGSILSQSGSTAGAIVAGGSTGPAYPETTEEYHSRFQAITTTAAWASGANYPAPVYGTGSGTNAPQTAAVTFGGNVSGSKSSATNEYNGSSWTSANAMSDVFIGGAYGGTQTAAFGAGGYAAPPSRTAATEQYDGTNWTTGGNLSVAASQNVGFGTSTAGVAYGGEGTPDPAIKTATQEYDGSSWTTVNTMPIGATAFGTGFGTQTAGVRNSGAAPTPNSSTWTGGPAGFVNITLLYDGTNWTSGANSNWGGRNSTGFGIQTSGVSCGGEGAPGTTSLTRTEQYDGTSWTDVATIPRTSTSYMAGFGASSGSGAIVGGVHSVTNSVEEFTGQVLTTQASTLTTS